MKNKNVTISSAVGTDLNVSKRVLCYVAGHSGGHSVPALTHARAHKAQHPTDHIIFIATDTPLDKTIVGAASYLHTAVYLKLDAVQRSFFKLPLCLVQFCKAFVQSMFVLRKFRVDELVSMGGYISLPVCLAARCLRISVTLFELNAEPGRATRFLAPHATSLFICFEGARPFFSTNVTRVPYPLRYQQVPTDEDIMQHKKAFCLVPRKKTVLLLGGSQGSVFLNSIIGRWFETMSESRSEVQIIHQTGGHDTRDWRSWYHNRGITSQVFAYEDDLALVYASADLIVCRAGAGTLFEVEFFKKRCVIVPLVTRTTSHQVDNARAMVARAPELFSMLDQVDIERDPTVLFARLNKELLL